MATITVSRRNVTRDELLAALGGQLANATVEPHGAGEVRVKTSAFAHAKVTTLPGGGGTTPKVSPYMIGPAGHLISTLGIAKRVTGALESAPQPRATSS